MLAHSAVSAGLKESERRLTGGATRRMKGKRKIEENERRKEEKEDEEKGQKIKMNMGLYLRVVKGYGEDTRLV